MIATPFEIISVIMGLIILIFGILLFYGKTKWGKRNYMIGGFVLTNEALGVLLFFLGIILMLGFIIPILTPRFSSPGMEGY
ncbi:MAG TPA: hypothetical protein VE978_06390 [Chitinophagales bacterium]|nr:hypothetical protein [Chitinophagales bacterium]